MILTADAEIVRKNRRETPNGWNTAFIGKNRYTADPNDPTPDPETIYPVGFLVEKGPGGITKPHFHRADQFQVVVGGSGKLGLHDTGSIAVHYTDAYSAYGPIVASDEGIAWFTLRNGWDPGARYMPQSRVELRASRDRYTHWEATTDPLPPVSEAVLRQATGITDTQIMEGDHGLASWRYQLPPGMTFTGRDPANSGGQYWLVLAGTATIAESAPFGVNSCMFVAPTDAALTALAGSDGAELLCMQFRVPYSARH